MPREITHWHVLERALPELERQAPAAAQCIRKYPAAAYLGAMAHDAPYYVRFGGDPFERIAEVLHGTGGEDTLAPIRELLEMTRRQLVAEQRELLTAFVYGMLSHYATDVVFHPMVYYFTGNYYHLDPQERRNARIRHRLFEAHLDRHVRIERRSLRISDLLSELGSNQLANICHALSSITAEMPFDQSRLLAGWRSSFAYMGNLQWTFHSPFLGLFIRILKNLTLGHCLSATDALFSFGRGPSSKQFFAAPLTYQNPISGDVRTAGLQELIDEVVRDYVTLLAACEESFAAGTKPLEDRIGRSLNFGIEGGGVEKARFFAADAPEFCRV